MINAYGKGDQKQFLIEGINTSTRKVSYDLIPDECQAIQYALQIAAPGDFIIALSDEYRKVVSIIREKMLQENAVRQLVSGDIDTSIAS